MYRRHRCYACASTARSGSSCSAACTLARSVGAMMLGSSEASARLVCPSAARSEP